MKHFCNIIPNYILKKISSNDQIVHSYLVRQKRKLLLENPSLKKIPKVTHNEIRRLFNSNNLKVLTGDAIAFDQQIHSTEQSKYPPLELANKCYDFFHNDFGLESYDNKNSPVDVYINYGKDYNNAFWDGEQMVFGNGDGIYFNEFLTQNIFTHEYTHAVTENQSGLIYENQSGALNEHISDVFAIVLDQKLANQSPSESSWIIGENLLTKKVKNGKGLRSFKDELAYDDPDDFGTDPQPKNMKNYQDLPNTEDGDWGGVHINSGIPNHAFYQFCNITQKKSWTEPSQIWFQTYRLLKPNTEFVEFANATIKVTNVLYPELNNQIKEAWKNVGVI